MDRLVIGTRGAGAVDVRRGESSSGSTIFLTHRDESARPGFGIYTLLHECRADHSLFVFTGMPTYYPQRTSKRFCNIKKTTVAHGTGCDPGARG